MGLNAYKKELRHYILTSRFNTSTWEENTNYRKLNPKIGCIYGSPCPVSMNIPNEAMLFVLEMNNDVNQHMTCLENQHSNYYLVE